MTEEQIKIGDKILELFVKYHGQLHGKVLIKTLRLEDKQLSTKKINTTLTIMVENYKLLSRHPSIFDLKTITKDGIKAHEIGFKKFIKEFEEKEKLELKSLKSNIETAKRSQTISIFALAISAIAPVLAVLVGIYIDKKNDVENTINKHPEYDEQNIPISQDTIPKDSLTKDSINFSN